MADTKLTKDQARTLLEKLARDDGFRVLFESAPAKALDLMGVDAKTIIHLPAMCLSPRKLASKADYEKLLESSSNDAINGAMQMDVPYVGFRAP